MSEPGRGQWVAAASLVVAVLTLLIALPGAINDWTTLRTPQPSPTDGTRSTAPATPTETATATTSATGRPVGPQPSKTTKPKPDGDDRTKASLPNILQRINKYRANLSVWGMVSLVAAGAVVIFICAGVCRFVIITSYWPIGLPTWAILIAVPLFAWPSVSGTGTVTLAVIGAVYLVTACIIAWIATAIADA